MEIFDTHAHLNNEKFTNDVEAVIKNARDNNVSYILNAGYDLKSSKKAVELAKNHFGLYASVGIHPHDASEYSYEVEVALEYLIGHNKVVAVGEIGLDYYRNLSPKEVQKEVFGKQIDLAKRLNKPIIIHDRDAHADVKEILEEKKAADIGVVLHCYSGSAQMAQEYVKKGYYISLAGPVTYPNAKSPVEVARVVPLDKLLIETDCPYLTPQPVRGKRNEPAYIKYVLEKIAEIKGKAPEEIAYYTTENAKRFFRIV